MKRFNPLLLCLWLGSVFSEASAQAPVHNSLPAAGSVVFLDFDGHTVSGTAWNWNGPIVCGSAGLSSAQITEVYNRVAEDFRPFQLNVTTDSAKFLAAPLTKRYRLILTTSSSWYGNAGGVAMIGSFSWGDDTPGFVFTELLNFNTSNIGKAASHEIGHALGLYHQVVYDQQCSQVAEYNPGVGQGATSWAPIMGVTYYRSMTGWHNGPNPYGCQNLQDELQLITQSGLGFRADDFSSDLRHPANAGFSGNTMHISGVIERPDDVDYFKFNLNGDMMFTLNALPFVATPENGGSNLDLSISLYDRKRALIAVYNPEEILYAVIDTLLSRGTYFIGVEGVGNINAPDYSCLGSYTLQATTRSASREMPGINLRVTEGRMHELTWEFINIAEMDQLFVEYSRDGKSFFLLTELPPGTSSFRHDGGSREIMYRVGLRSAQSAPVYSNKVIAKPVTERPGLIGNMVKGSLVMRLPENVEYVITDLQGKTYMRGKFPGGQHTLALPNMRPGLYLLQFHSAAGVHTEKFMVQ